MSIVSPILKMRSDKDSSLHLFLQYAKIVEDLKAEIESLKNKVKVLQEENGSLKSQVRKDHVQSCTLGV